ncbi:MAG: polymerase delta subunit [Eubacterium sp.]|nr:polymerase delta subunit [Eubacterium sp.]
MLGHRKILAGLQETIKNDNVGHAYIFEGPDGIGRRETALSFAAMLMCEQDHSACGECKSCQLFSEGSNPDFQEIYSAEKSISVDDIRNVLKGLVIRPLYSEYKIIIINDADSMTVQAQNALLKSLEEPPPYVVFILTVQSGAAVTPTVRSRCQRVLFSRFSNEEIMAILEARYQRRRPEWAFIVSYSDGVIGTALELIESPEYMELRDEVLNVAGRLLEDKDGDIFKIYELFEKNNDKIDFILRIMLLFFRDIIIYNQTANYNILINSDKKDMIIDNAGLKLSGLLKCINAVWSAKRGLEYNANYQLAIEVMLMKIKDSYV